jgi:Predicted Zn-dependent protease
MGKSRVYRLAADVGLQTNPVKLAQLANGDKDQTISDASREKLSTEKLKRMLDTTYDADKIGSVCNWPLTRQLNAVAYAVSSSPPSERNELNDLWQVLADAYNIGKHYDESYETSLSLLQSRKQSAQTPIDPADLTDNLWQLAYICSVSYRLQEAKQYFDEVVKHHKSMNERTTGYLHYVRGLVNDSNGLPKEAVADFRIALKCLKNYLPTLHPIDEAEEIDHTRWLIYDIEQELKAKRKRGPDAPDYYGAYESTQWTHDRFPLKICIDQTPEHGFGPRLLSSFRKSIDEWMSASKLTDDSPLSYKLIDNKEEADIYLERVDSWDLIPYGSGGGATARYVMRDGKLTNDLDLVHLRVYCATPDPEEMSNYEIAQLEGLVLHELGHAFGLGHSSSGLDIMYWKSAAKNLSHRDKATLLRIYGCQAKR